MQSVKSVKPTNLNYRQGYFVPEYPEKYVGDINNIIYRSSWEFKFMIYCDRNSFIKSWASEPFPIPYYNPFDNKIHQYYVDFWMVIQQGDEPPKKYLVEIKPKSKTQEPIFEYKFYKKNVVEKYNYVKKEYIINLNKWKAAKDFCEKSNMNFIILTEEHLNINVRKKSK